MKTTCCKLCQSERKKNITLIKHFKIMLINRDQTPSIQAHFKPLEFTFSPVILHLTMNYSEAKLG